MVKKVRTAINRVRLVSRLVTIIREPERVGDVFALGEALMDDKMREAMVQTFMRFEQGRRALAERPRLGRIALAPLLALPEGMLGRVYADHMVANGLDPATLPIREARTPKEYVLPHIFESHDILHVLTGFGTDVPGELGLQAFSTAQWPSRGPVALLTAGFLNMLFLEPETKEERLNAITRGWVLGRTAKPVFGIRWAELWETPIDEVRRRYDIDLARVDGLTKHSEKAAA
jgi:ubiquinone biosynthesis protein COQ4